MATMHVWSGAGASASPYDNWQKAAVNLSTAAGAAAAGDTIYVAHDHAETAAGQTIAFTNGTLAAPIKVICGTRTGTATETGISALATTANIISSTAGFSMTSGVAYVYGVEFEQTYNGGTATMNLNNASGANHTYESCKFLMTSTISSSIIRSGASGSTSSTPLTILKGCQFQFGSTSQSFCPGGHTEVYGGSTILGSTPATYFAPGNTARGANVLVSGFDFSNLGTGFDLLKQGNDTQRVLIRNCKLPSGWTGEIHNAAPSAGTRWELINYGAGDTNYKFWTSDVYGQCKDETTIYRTSGAQDEATPYSMLMVSTANVSWPGHSLRSLPIMQRHDAVAGNTVTVTVHICHDGASALTDQECWLELEHLANAVFPLASFSNDTTTITGSPTAQTSSGEAWTGDSGTGPNGTSTWNQLKLVCAGVTLAETGYVIGRVHLAKAGTTIYVDPKLEIVED